MDSGWLTKFIKELMNGGDIKYIHPVKVLSRNNNNKKVCASQLTYKEFSGIPNDLLAADINAHFVGLPIGSWHTLDKEQICKSICDGALQKYGLLRPKQLNEVIYCRYEIAQHHDFLRQDPTVASVQYGKVKILTSMLSLYPFNRKANPWFYILGPCNNTPGFGLLL